MENNFLNKNSVLVLNALYQIIGITSVKKALITMSAESSQGQCVAKSIDIQYGKNPDGSWNFDDVISFIPCSFEEWISVPIREGIDTNVIHSARLTIRPPSVLLALNYSKVPYKKFRPTKQVLFSLQKGKLPDRAVCGYSLEELPFSRLSIEHVIPRSYGGKSSFGNLLLINKEINSKRGNKPLSELGLTPHFKHQEPRPIPVSFTIKHALSPDWLFFLRKQ